jgi:hypothetical protein
MATTAIPTPTPTAVAILALLLTACAPRGGLSPDLAADPAKLLADVRAKQEVVRRVQGGARIRIDSPDVKGTVSAFAAAEKPARVRIELHDFFGNPAAVLVADGDRFGFYDARSKTFYRGDASAENVSRFLPVVVPPSELVTILCGSAPILAGAAVEATPRRGAVLLVVAAGEVGQRLEVVDELAIASSRVRRDAPDPAAQAAFYDLELDGFRHRAGVRFPTEVRLDAPSARSRVRLRWRDDLEVNGAVDAGLFRLDPPRGAKVVDLPPGGVVPDVPLPIDAAESAAEPPRAPL